MRPLPVHALRLGLISFLQSFTRGRAPQRLRLLTCWFVRRWTPVHPIWSFAIEHPEGVVLVDRTETPTVYLPAHDPGADRRMLARETL